MADLGPLLAALGSLFARLGPLLARLGPLLGRSRAALGAVLGALGAILAALGVLLAAPEGAPVSPSPTTGLGGTQFFAGLHPFSATSLTSTSPQLHYSKSSQHNSFFDPPRPSS